MAEMSYDMPRTMGYLCGKAGELAEILDFKRTTSHFIGKVMRGDNGNFTA